MKNKHTLMVQKLKYAKFSRCENNVGYSIFISPSSRAIHFEYQIFGGIQCGVAKSLPRSDTQNGHCVWPGVPGGRGNPSHTIPPGGSHHQLTNITNSAILL